MLCRKCGHKSEEHSVVYHDPSSAWCSECYRFGQNKNKNRFFEHEFEGNLEYLERMAAKKELDKKQKV